MRFSSGVKNNNKNNTETDCICADTGCLRVPYDGSQGAAKGSGRCFAS